ncbi:MAG: thiosulfate oxidation carrier protein SoxY [Chromatiales bacterium]
MPNRTTRRLFLKTSIAASTLGVALGAGLLSPRTVMAAWPAEAFKARKTQQALQALMGNESTSPSESITIKAPDIAENGAVVPVTIDTSINGAESIALIASNNATPLVASFNLGKGAQGYVSTRIKMGKTGDVVAVVKSGGKLFSARKGVKVTIGGCGG